MNGRELGGHVELLRLESRGVLDDLPCPACGADTVQVRYTNPFEGEYRVWFLCSRCDFRTRAQASGKPPHYTPERVDEELQEQDRR
ncbi:MAG: hypothetical protein KDB73_17030 [Planctomycetes bacterium]|nr:hypothetical protein [Planctomycetota bacterium]